MISFETAKPRQLATVRLVTKHRPHPIASAQYCDVSLWVVTADLSFVIMYGGYCILSSELLILMKAVNICIFSVEEIEIVEKKETWHWSLITDHQPPRLIILSRYCWLPIPIWLNKMSYSNFFWIELNPSNDRGVQLVCYQGRWVLIFVTNKASTM